MTHTIICRMKPYIQPFERKLALTELIAIGKAEPKPLTQKNVVCVSGEKKHIADLWSEAQIAIEIADGGDTTGNSDTWH